MNLKSIGLCKKMKFSMSISNQSLPYSDYPDDVQCILEPSHLLFVRYSKYHILSPKSDVPNIFCATPDIPVEDDGNSNLLTSSPKGLYSLTADILRACGRDSYLQLLSKCAHFHCYKSESTNLDSFAEYLRTRPDNDISLPKQYGNSDCLLYVNYDDIQPYAKGS